MPKIGVLLSGCGVYDGSEIHEAVLTLLALNRKQADIICMAPNIEQYDVINHLTQNPMSEKRNVLIESARIARGDIKDIAEVNATDLDGLILPGGFGAAKNLSDFALKGKDAKLYPEVQRLLNDMQAAHKPIGGICISPAILAKAFCEKAPEVTIGKDTGIAQTIEAMGAVHKQCTVDAIHYDEKYNLVTTPAYMLGPEIKDVAEGIEKLVDKVLALVEKT
jgi:enhancing lycopene biosynthesis protein 2